MLREEKIGCEEPFWNDWMNGIQTVAVQPVLFSFSFLGSERFRVLNQRIKTEWVKEQKQ